MIIRKESLVDAADLKKLKSEEDEQLVRVSCNECVKFMASMSWCEKIQSVYYGGGLPGKADVFLVELVPTVGSGADQQVWVVCGDLPIAYIRADLNMNPEQALSDYIGVMKSWVRTVQAGGSLENEYPVSAEPTKQNACLLHKRLEFISNQILGSEMLFE